MKTVDYIIVGQGIAGSMLGYMLETAGVSFKVIDDGYQTSSSQVGAGIINPLTGRNYVLAWEYGLHLEEVISIYQKIEREIKLPLLIGRNIIRTLFSPKNVNNWHERLNNDAYQQYMLQSAELGAYESLLSETFQYGEVTQSYQLNMPRLIHHFAQKWKRLGQFLEEKFDYERLLLSEDSVKYREIEAKGLIFCEGQQVKTNPFFSSIPIGDSKGEILKVKIQGFRASKMIKQRRFIVPLEADEFWFGSYDRWGASSGAPTSEGRDRLVNELSRMINKPFEVIAHEAALRPTTPDRRPLLGTHPHHHRLHLLNGLGTKGASLAPRWSKCMVEYLLGRNSIPEQVDVKRFLGNPAHHAS